MPTIVFASSKGGAGKTTSAFLLACELADRDMTVTIVDADPNHPITRWEQNGGKLHNLSIISNDSEEQLSEDIERAKAKSNFVIVDLEGSANLSIAYAVSYADLVIIPTQRSTLDLSEAAKAFQLIKKLLKNSTRTVPITVLVTRTAAAIVTKGQRRMYESFKNNGIDLFEVELNEREAFKAVFDHFKTLSQLNAMQVGGLDKARNNATEFAKQSILKLKKVKHEQKVKEVETV